MTQNKHTVIIDTDPGADDCAAILMAFGLEQLYPIKILGITTVCGNVSVEYTTRNARIICDWANRQDVPIYQGATKPILNPLHDASEVHGETGLADALLHDLHTPLQEISAHFFLINTLKQCSPQSITLCTLGPLTNIALALLSEPSCQQGIKEIVIMGGNYLQQGNVTPNAEFNFFTDPLAAKIVLHSGVPLKIFPLDVTYKALVTTPRMNCLRQLNNQNGKRVADLLQSFSRFDIQQFGLEGGPLHDPCPIAYLVAPQYFSYRQVFATIEPYEGLMRGAMQVDWNRRQGHKPNSQWYYDIDADAFFKLLENAIAQLP